MIGDLTWSEAADLARAVRSELERIREARDWPGLGYLWDQIDQLARDCDEQGRNEEVTRRQAEAPRWRGLGD